LVAFREWLQLTLRGLAPNSVHRWPSAQLEWEPELARTSAVERPASFLLQILQNRYE
jgi:hypothetical protein